MNIAPQRLGYGAYIHYRATLNGAQMAFRGVRRALAAHLMSDATTTSGQPVRAALLEFLLHGVKYAYPPEHGALTRGVPTGYAAPPLNNVIGDSNDPLPVWPYAEGSVRGVAFTPLYPSVPAAALKDSRLYELLALVDAIRDGRARERDFATTELTSRLTVVTAR